MIASPQCYDCKGYETSCQLCFVEAHIRNPFHWAEVWDTTQGFFVRHDISKLNHIIQLGHNGKPCPEPCGKRLFAVVDDNGLHSTCLAFCGCHELPANKVKQLVRAGLFPATGQTCHLHFARTSLNLWLMATAGTREDKTTPSSQNRVEAC
ncbi:hypothetical protein B0H10DRAFT_1805575 [Mycena sp. CBHHK59/15]|nr:hypothetical protein B0H10DRAFT_1805575 [Mycena sp. CBHHK59/15]